VQRASGLGATAGQREHQAHDESDDHDRGGPAAQPQPSAPAPGFLGTDLRDPFSRALLPGSVALRHVWWNVPD
jgi:hypothetical protein